MADLLLNAEDFSGKKQAHFLGNVSFFLKMNFLAILLALS